MILSSSLVWSRRVPCILAEEVVVNWSRVVGLWVGEEAMDEPLRPQLLYRPMALTVLESWKPCYASYVMQVKLQEELQEGDKGTKEESNEENQTYIKISAI